jgi:hypothetical protein
MSIGFNITKLSPLWGLAAICAAGFISAGAASAAPITFAQFVETDGAQDWNISESTSAGVTTTTTEESGSAYFSFQGTGAQPFGGSPTLANFTLDATSTSLGNCAVACGAGDGFTEAGYSGTFSFTDAVAGSLFGTNFLSGTFAVTGSPATTGAQFTSNIGSGNASFTASSTAGNLNQLIFTSAYLNFSPTTTEEVASFSLSSLIPSFTVTTPINNQAYPNGTFAAAGSGTFSSNPAPSSTPEPATLGLVGAALIGMGVIRRRKTSRA